MRILVLTLIYLFTAISHGDNIKPTVEQLRAEIHRTENLLTKYQDFLKQAHKDNGTINSATGLALFYSLFSATTSGVGYGILKYQDNKKGTSSSQTGIGLKAKNIAIVSTALSVISYYLHSWAHLDQLDETKVKILNDEIEKTITKLKALNVALDIAKKDSVATLPILVGDIQTSKERIKNLEKSLIEHKVKNGAVTVSHLLWSMFYAYTGYGFAQISMKDYLKNLEKQKKANANTNPSSGQKNFEIEILSESEKIPPHLKELNFPNTSDSKSLIPLAVDEGIKRHRFEVWAEDMIRFYESAKQTPQKIMSTTYKLKNFGVWGLVTVLLGGLSAQELNDFIKEGKDTALGDEQTQFLLAEIAKARKELESLEKSIPLASAK